MFHKNPGIIINTVKENEVAKYSQKILFGITLEKFSNEPLLWSLISMKSLDAGKQLYSKGHLLHKFSGELSCFFPNNCFYGSQFKMEVELSDLLCIV